MAGRWGRSVSDNKEFWNRTKKFSSKSYKPYVRTATKREATGFAESARAKLGLSARITKEAEGYVVWTR